MTPHELGLMTKQAITTKLIQRVANKAWQSGKFGKDRMGVSDKLDRMQKFTDKIRKWAPGAFDRATGSTYAAGKKVPVHLSMQRTIRKLPSFLSERGKPGLPQKPWYNFWSGPTKTDGRMLNRRTLDKMHEAFGGTEKGTNHIKPVVYLGKGNRGFFGHPDTVVAPRNNSATLMHELGHAYTAPKIYRNWSRAAGASTSGDAPVRLPEAVERAALVLEASANRRAIAALRKLQGQMPGIPSVKGYRDFARPQYETYRLLALQHFLKGKVPDERVPNWIKRLGFEV